MAHTKRKSRIYASTVSTCTDSIKKKEHEPNPVVYLARNLLKHEGKPLFLQPSSEWKKAQRNSLASKSSLSQDNCLGCRLAIIFLLCVCVCVFYNEANNRSDVSSLYAAIALKGYARSILTFSCCSTGTSLKRSSRSERSRPCGCWVKNATAARKNAFNARLFRTFNT